MRNIALSLYLLALAVFLSVTPDTETSTLDYDLEELLELEKTFLRSKLIADGAKQTLPACEQVCYNAHQICTNILKTQKAVCAQHDKHGLVDFPNICELRFQNCLTNAYEERTGNQSRTGLFYYNAEGQECQYYFNRAQSLEQAIEYYYMDDMEYKIKRYAKKH